MLEFIQAQAMPPPTVGTAANPALSGPALDPADLAGRTLSPDLCALAKLYTTSEGYLYSARSHLREVTLLVPASDHQSHAAAPTDPLGRPRQRVLEDRVRQLEQIQHPNVAEIYETGETSEGLFYLVLEPLTGSLLSTLLATRGPCQPLDAIDICLEVAAALKAAHAHGVAHGNVSPQTILVAGTADLRPRVKLLGFTLGPFLPQESPEQREASRYASVESVYGVAADERSDVFSLGAVLHHLLSGSPPESDEVDDSIPRGIRRVLTKALADAPGNRYQTMAEFADALEGVRQAATRPQGTSLPRQRMVGAALVVMLGSLLVWRWHPAHQATPTPPVLPNFSGVEVGASSAVAPEPDPPKPAARPRKPQVRAPVVGQPKPRSATASAPARVSPYRRAHPWAAPPGGRFYYRSSCPEVLRFPDLMFFASEREARDKGFRPSNIPECR
jgi:serine/threonine protein kinase